MIYACFLSVYFRLTVYAKLCNIVSMFLFFTKKNFCDVWDNLFHTVIVNLVITIGAILAASLAYFIMGLAAAVFGDGILQNLCQIAAVVIACVIVCTLVIAEGENAVKIVSFEGPKIQKFFSNILPSLKDGIYLGLYIAFLFLISFVCFPFYFNIWIPADGSQGNIIGLALLSLLFWFLVITILSLQYFVAIRSIMHNNFKKCLKKCYILFFDNAFFTIGLFFMNLINLALMIFTLSIGNGLATMTITCTEALRLRLYKYDWLEVNPGLTRQQRKDVPWADLIANDKRILGPRKWKSFIFPWRE